MTLAKENRETLIRNIWNGKNKTHSKLYSEYSKILQKAVTKVMTDDRYFGTKQKLLANVNRFAAYKAYHTIRLISISAEASKESLIDGQKACCNGIEHSDKEYRKQAERILRIFSQWGRIEYNITISRARTAKQWIDYNDSPISNKLYPNMKWLPNTCKEHSKLWGIVLPKDDPFWKFNQPGNIWSCNCEWKETSEPAKGTVPASVRPTKGLEGNPATTGKVFTDRATYFAKAPKDNDCLKDVDKQYRQHLSNAEKYVMYDTKEWKKEKFYNNGGYLATDKVRVKQGQRNEQEKSKFEKEHSMCETLSKNGYAVEYLKEVDGKYDIHINNIPTDLKKTKSHNHIVDYALKAVKKQGADIVVFEFENMNAKITEQLKALKKRGIKVIYYETNNEDKINTL
ncbi:MAG: hypothetical protein LBQ31_07890 [Bacteroidales bacterium]|jgi:hypothetical protein|nr:hypothetical protein [Bacteroidales bacterium]